MNAAELTAEARRLSSKLDEGIRAVAQESARAAEAERVYRKLQARMWLAAPEGTVAARQAWVDGECADARHERDVAQGRERAADLAVRARSKQISLLQSVAAAHRAEAEMAKYGPEMGP